MMMINKTSSKRLTLFPFFSVKNLPPIIDPIQKIVKEIAVFISSSRFDLQFEIANGL